MPKREVSKKYPGVYWLIVPCSDGHGVERSYYIRYRRGGRGTKQFNEPVGKTSSGMTEARANQIRAARMTGNAPNNSEQREAAKLEKLAGDQPRNVDWLWKLYLDSHAGNRSIRDDVNRYNRHAMPRIGTKLIANLTTNDLEVWRRQLEKAGLSPQSVKHCLGLLKRIIRYGENAGLITLPQPLVFPMPKFDNRKTENMTAEQLAAYWQALDEEPDQNAAGFFKLALLTGMRRGAVMALKWTDCDFDNGLITLRADSAKNGKSSRIPMNEAARTVLLGIERADSEYVFPGHGGAKRAAAPKLGKRLRDKAGLPKDFRPSHGLRHVFASLLASSGKVTLYELQNLLTHGSPIMTQRYAELTDEAMRRAASVANMIAKHGGNSG